MPIFENDAVESGSSALSATFDSVRGLASGFTAEVSEATAAMQTMDGEAKKLSRSLGSSLRSAFDQAIFGGKSFSDVLKGLGRDIAGSALDAALKPVQNAVGSSLTSLVGGLTNGLTGLFGFADGGAFSSGRVRAFAKGGVVDGPTVFPMRGATGLMGEAGPEAIMPLTRGPDGRLGVAAQGGGQGMNITVNISTPDIQGFQQSRSQVAAQLARAVQRGSRNL